MTIDLWGDEITDLYKQAAEWGLNKAKEEFPEEQRPFLQPEALIERAQYWTAWWAGRRACGMLLAEARRIGVTDKQWEALRKVAAEVAYD